MDEEFVQGLFDEQGQDEAVPEELAAQATAGARAFRGAVLAGVDALVLAGHIELAPDAREALGDELAAAGLDARTPRHALKKLRGALMDSDHVEEVYADNRAIEAAFRRAMGG